MEENKQRSFTLTNLSFQHKENPGHEVNFANAKAKRKKNKVFDEIKNIIIVSDRERLCVCGGQWGPLVPGPLVWFGSIDRVTSLSQDRG